MSSQLLSDEELIAKGRSGEITKDEVADALILRYTHLLFLFGIRAGLDTSTSEELVQETFLEAFRRFELFKELPRTRNWLLALFKSRLTAYLRKQKAPVRIINGVEDFKIEEIKSEHPDAETSLIKKENFLLLKEAIEALPPDLYIIVSLVYSQDLTIEEAAKALELPEDGVRNRMRLARKLLLRNLKNRNITLADLR